MDRLLARLERRFGKYAIGNLTAIVVAGMAAVFLLSMIRPDLLGMLTLDIRGVEEGQVWRLFTYLFLPRTLSLWWIIFSLGFVFYIGTNLESHWGSFQFNVYYAAGMVGTTAAAASYFETVLPDAPDPLTTGIDDTGEFSRILGP